MDKYKLRVMGNHEGTVEAIVHAEGKWCKVADMGDLVNAFQHRQDKLVESNIALKKELKLTQSLHNSVKAMMIYDVAQLLKVTPPGSGTDGYSFVRLQQAVHDAEKS